MKKSVIIILLFLMLLMPLVSAAGTSFDDAQMISVGDYSGVATKDSPVYYKIVIGSGQRVNINISYSLIEKNGHGRVEFFDESRESITKSDSDYVTHENPTQKIEVHRVAADPGATLYMKVSAYGEYDWYASSLSYYLIISLEDNSDIGSGKDAGADFDTAMPILPGYYPKNWLIAGESGNDEKDMYKLDLKKNEKLTIKLTPETKALLGLAIYDGNRALQYHREAPNTGAIISVDYMGSNDQTVYVAALRDFGGALGGYYSLNLSVEQVQAVCSAGAKKCDGNSLMQCSSDGTKFTLYKTCDYGCKNNACSSPPSSQKTTSSSSSDNLGAAGTVLGGIFGAAVLYIIVVIILGILSFVLWLIAQISIWSSGNDSGWKFLWGFISFIGIIGPLLYFFIGKKSRIKKGEKAYQQVSQQPAQFPQSQIPMLIPTELKSAVDFIRDARNKGFSDMQIKAALLKQGWPADNVDSAFKYV